MLKEITAFAVIATMRNLDLFAVHIILYLIVPHPSAIRVIPVNNLDRTKRARERGSSQISFWVE